MTILVTGAGGFLGQAVVRRLAQSGMDTVAVSRTGENQSVAADLSDPAVTWSLVQAHRPKTIVNCAAIAEFAPNTAAQQYPVNALTPAVLASYCRASGAHMIQASGSLVHGAQTQIIDSDTPLNPDTDYGKTKLLSEQMIELSGCDALILRFCGLFGKNGPDHLMLNRTIRNAAKGIPPTVFATGAARRNYLFIGDAALMIEDCIISRRTGIHLAAGSEILSIADMAKEICRIYLPGHSPLYEAGREAIDQIVHSSPHLIQARSFTAALEAER